MRVLNVAIAVLAFSLCVLGSSNSAHATACAVNGGANNYHPPAPPHAPIHTVPPYVTLPKPPPVPHGKHDDLFPPSPPFPPAGGQQVNIPPYGCFQAPGMENPLIITGKCAEDIGGKLNTGGRDVIFEMPKDRVCKGKLDISHTGNVLIRGGKILVTEEQSQGISIHEIPAGKTVFIEGVEVDGNNKNSDLIRTYRANDLNVFVQNTYLHGARWGQDFHADCFHAQGGGALGNLVFQNVTCIDTGNQGFQVPYRTSDGGVGTKRLIMDHVDLSWGDVPRHGGVLNFGGTGQFGDSVPPNGVAVRDLYVKDTQTISPQPTWHTDGQGDCSRYGTWGDPKIQGKVCAGLPGVNGHFATEATVGLNYNRGRFCDGSGEPPPVSQVAKTVPPPPNPPGNYNGTPANLPPGQCAQPPKLTNPKVVTVSTNGGSYSFGDNEDVLLQFPKGVVTGAVTINGGRNIHGIGGTMNLTTGHYAIAVNNHGSNGEIFFEGMNINVNNRCDVFALRNQKGAQLNVTLQNIFAYGPGYNTVNGNCHGDLAQFQYGNNNGGYSLRVENFTGYTGGQGFFLPHRQSGQTSVAMRNVNVDYVPNPYRGGLTALYFQNDDYADDRKKYPVQLDNVYVDWMKADRHIVPWKGKGRIDVSDTESRFDPSTLIKGSVKKGKPGGDFVTAGQTGANYNRGNFCKN